MSTIMKVAVGGFALLFVAAVPGPAGVEEEEIEGLEAKCLLLDGFERDLCLLGGDFGEDEEEEDSGFFRPRFAPEIDREELLQRRLLGRDLFFDRPLIGRPFIRRPFLGGDFEEFEFGED